MNSEAGTGPPGDHPSFVGDPLFGGRREVFHLAQEVEVLHEAQLNRSDLAQSRPCLGTEKKSMFTKNDFVC